MTDSIILPAADGTPGITVLPDKTHGEVLMIAIPLSRDGIVYNPDRKHPLDRSKGNTVHAKFGGWGPTPIVNFQVGQQVHSLKLSVFAATAGKRPSAPEAEATAKAPATLQGPAL